MSISIHSMRNSRKQCRLEMEGIRKNSYKASMMKVSIDSDHGGVKEKTELWYSWLMFFTTRSSSIPSGMTIQSTSWPLSMILMTLLLSMEMMRIIMSMETSSLDLDQILLFTIFFQRENTSIICIFSVSHHLTEERQTMASSFSSLELIKLDLPTTLITKITDSWLLTWLPSLTSHWQEFQERETQSFSSRWWTLKMATSNTLNFLEVMLITTSQVRTQKSQSVFKTWPLMKTWEPVDLDVLELSHLFKRMVILIAS